MAFFLLGALAFFGIHLVTLSASLKQRGVARFGAQGWRGVVALVSLLGLVLMVVGWPELPRQALFAPVAWAVHAAPITVSAALVLVLMGGIGLKGYIRRFTHHPMLMGVGLWAATHLLANGGVRETLLFGSFLGFSVYALFSVFWAGKRANFTPSLKWDVLGIAAGVFVAVGVMHSHRLLFGVAVM